MIQYLDGDSIPIFLNCVLSTDSSVPIYAQRECIALLGATAVHHHENCLPHLHRMISAIVRRLKTRDSMLRDVCANSMGLLVAHILVRPPASRNDSPSAPSTPSSTLTAPLPASATETPQTPSSDPASAMSATPNAPTGTPLLAPTPLATPTPTARGSGIGSGLTGTPARRRSPHGQGQGSGHVLNAPTLAPFLKAIFAALMEQNPVVQQGAATCLEATIACASTEHLLHVLPRLTQRIARFLTPHGTRQAVAIAGSGSPHLLAAASALIAALGDSVIPHLPQLIPLAISLLAMEDWNTRRASAELLQLSARILGPVLSPFRDAMEQGLEAARFDKVKPVREAISDALKALRACCPADSLASSLSLTTTRNVSASPTRTPTPTTSSSSSSSLPPPPGTPGGTPIVFVAPSPGTPAGGPQSLLSESGIGVVPKPQRPQAPQVVPASVGTWRRIWRTALLPPPETFDPSPPRSAHSLYSTSRSVKHARSHTAPSLTPSRRLSRERFQGPGGGGGGPQGHLFPRGDKEREREEERRREKEEEEDVLEELKLQRSTKLKRQLEYSMQVRELHASAARRPSPQWRSPSPADTHAHAHAHAPNRTLRRTPPSHTRRLSAGSPSKQGRPPTPTHTQRGRGRGRGRGIERRRDEERLSVSAWSAASHSPPASPPRVPRNTPRAPHDDEEDDDYDRSRFDFPPTSPPSEPPSNMSDHPPLPPADSKKPPPNNGGDWDAMSTTPPLHSMVRKQGQPVSSSTYEISPQQQQGEEEEEEESERGGLALPRVGPFAIEEQEALCGGRSSESRVRMGMVPSASSPALTSSGASPSSLSGEPTRAQSARRASRSPARPLSRSPSRSRAGTGTGPGPSTRPRSRSRSPSARQSPSPLPSVSQPLQQRSSRSAARRRSLSPSASGSRQRSLSPSVSQRHTPSTHSSRPASPLDTPVSPHTHSARLPRRSASLTPSPPRQAHSARPHSPAPSPPHCIARSTSMSPPRTHPYTHPHPHTERKESVSPSRGVKERLENAALRSELKRFTQQHGELLARFFQFMDESQSRIDAMETRLTSLNTTLAATQALVTAQEQSPIELPALDPHGDTPYPEEAPLSLHTHGHTHGAHAHAHARNGGLGSPISVLPADSSLFASPPTPPPAYPLGSPALSQTRLTLFSPNVPRSALFASQSNFSPEEWQEISDHLKVRNYEAVYRTVLLSRDASLLPRIMRRTGNVLASLSEPTALGVLSMIVSVQAADGPALDLHLEWIERALEISLELTPDLTDRLVFLLQDVGSAPTQQGILACRLLEHFS